MRAPEPRGSFQASNHVAATLDAEEERIGLEARAPRSFVPRPATLLDQVAEFGAQVLLGLALWQAWTELQGQRRNPLILVIVHPQVRARGAKAVPHRAVTSAHLLLRCRILRKLR